MSANVRIKFARKPRGGSFVIFRPFCSTGTGNALDGIDVSHRRYSSLTSSSCAASSSCSMRGSQLTARWQFCRQTQLPLARPSHSQRSEAPPADAAQKHFLEQMAAKKASMAEMGRQLHHQGPENLSLNM